MELIINLTINGLATGMLIFLLASGLTLIFGLMGVLNFAHGGLFAWGAFSGIWVYGLSGSFIIGILGAILTGAILGFITEKLIITPVYGNHVQQILITLGFMLVLTEMLKVVWGPNQIAAKAPTYLAGSWEFGDVLIIKYRFFIIIVGFLIFGIFQYILKRTKIGLIVRAGVMNKDMVQALGININRVFLLCFYGRISACCIRWCFVGSVFWCNLCRDGNGICHFSLYCCRYRRHGKFSRLIIAAILVGLAGSYMAYYVPVLSLAVNMILMAIVLIFRPQGLFKAKE